MTEKNEAAKVEPLCVAVFTGTGGPFTCGRRADSLYHRCGCITGNRHEPRWDCHLFATPAPVADAEPERGAKRSWTDEDDETLYAAFARAATETPVAHPTEPRPEGEMRAATVHYTNNPPRPWEVHLFGVPTWYEWTETVARKRADEVNANYAAWNRRAAPPLDAHASRSMSVMQDDMAELLRALGIGDHARPYSAHDVMVSEIIPAVRAALTPMDVQALAEHRWVQRLTEEIVNEFHNVHTPSSRIAAVRAIIERAAERGAQ